MARTTTLTAVAKRIAANTAAVISGLALACGQVAAQTPASTATCFPPATTATPAPAASPESAQPDVASDPATESAAEAARAELAKWEAPKRETDQVHATRALRDMNTCMRELYDAASESVRGDTDLAAARLLPQPTTYFGW